MVPKLLLFFSLLFITASCQFTETLVLNPDGSGTISVELNMNEMMAFAGSMGDSAIVKVDTTIYIKEYLNERKDSIYKLSEADQQKLKALENYNIKMNMNSETSELVYSVFTNFKNVSEANNILYALEQVEKLIPSQDVNMAPKTEKEKESESPEIIGVAYSFKNGIFQRDAFIKDKESHQRQMDSLKQTEMFLGGSNYKLNYTFPKKIKITSNPSATLSADGKTVTIEQHFIEYLKNPDLLDLKVVLEK